MKLGINFVYTLYKSWRVMKSMKRPSLRISYQRAESIYERHIMLANGISKEGCLFSAAFSIHSTPIEICNSVRYILLLKLYKSPGSARIVLVSYLFFTALIKPQAIFYTSVSVNVYMRGSLCNLCVLS